MSETMPETETSTAVAGQVERRVSTGFDPEKPYQCFHCGEPASSYFCSEECQILISHYSVFKWSGDRPLMFSDRSDAQKKEPRKNPKLICRVSSCRWWKNAYCTAIAPETAAFREC